MITMLADIDPSDTFDTQRFDEWEVPNIDHTNDVPMSVRFPDTTDVHPADCACFACEADREYADYCERVVVTW